MTVAVRRSGRLATARPRAVLCRRLPGSTLTRELLVAAGRPRAAFIKVAFPLALAVPLVAGHAPTFWAATLLTVLVAMVGTVGTAVALARARQSGLLVRLALVPRPAWRTVGGWLLASTVIDTAQVLPVVAVAAAAGGGDVPSVTVLALAATTCLLVAAVVGCAVASLGGGIGEVLLDVSVVIAPLLYLGGLFTGVPRSGWRQAAAAIDPFGQLHSAFVNALGGQSAFAPGSVAAASVIQGAVALLGAAALSRWVMERAR